MGPDGVHVEVTEDVDGEEVVNEYDGATLDELLETYPELREHVDATGGFGLGGGLFGGGRQRGAPLDWRAPGLRSATPWWQPGGDPGAAGAPRTDVLGVYVRAEVGDAFADVERPAGVGLAVDGVAPGTIAAALGIERGALLLELGDRQLRSRDDISAVLGAREPEQSLRAVWVDASGARHEQTWTPPPASRRVDWSGNLRRM
jgi:hypothetical protein